MQKITPVVIGLLKQDDRFLIAKRPEHVLMSNYWEFPGGKIEDHETQFDALIRELQEEVAVKIIHADFLAQFQAVFPDRIIQLNLWQIKKHLHTPKGNEGQEIRWVKAVEFIDYEFLPSNKELLAFVMGM